MKRTKNEALFDAKELVLALGEADFHHVLVQDGDIWTGHAKSNCGRMIVYAEAADGFYTATLGVVGQIGYEFIGRSSTARGAACYVTNQALARAHVFQGLAEDFDIKRFEDEPAKKKEQKTLKVFGGYYHGRTTYRIIMACASRTAFARTTRLPMSHIAETKNEEERFAAMSAPNIPFGSSKSASMPTNRKHFTRWEWSTNTGLVEPAFKKT